MAGIKPPKPLVVNSDIDMSTEWSEWIELYKHYFIATKLNHEPEEVRYSNFYSVLGRDGIRTVRNLKLSEAVRNNVDAVVAVLTQHFAPPKNKTYERCQFHRIKQDANQNFEDFLEKLRAQITKCGYGINDDEFVMDQIVVGINSDSTRQKLWTEEELNFEKAVKICRAAERAEKEIKEINNTASEVSATRVDSVKEPRKFDCKRCGANHEIRACAAYKKVCYKCDKEGHFARMCNARQQQSEQRGAGVEKKKSQPKKVNNIQQESDSDEEFTVSVLIEKTVDALGDTEDEWMETLEIENDTIEVKLDTGAGCNVMSQRDANRLQLEILRSKTKRIIAYNDESIPVIGEVIAHCKSKLKEGRVLFKVVAEDLEAILGRKMCVNMGFIVRVHQVDETEETKQSSRVGCINNFVYDIDLVKNPKFKIMPPRRIAHALKDQVKQELDNMEKMKVIRRVSKPTPVVSPLVIKQEVGKIRICLDPTDLNKSVKRRHYPLKTVEEVAATVRDSKWFTKLDCKKGFWQIPVTERTSDYLTFATPWGRYQYLRLPFGISSAPEVFSEVMNKTLEGIDNCESAMDDIFLHAKSKDELVKITETVIRRLDAVGLTLNMEKCQFNKQRVKFLGHIFTPEGIEADPTKIEAIQKIMQPKNPKQVQRFLGMVTYLSKFIHNLSQITEPIRMLTHKGVKWSWGPVQEEAFQGIKNIITTAPVLRYYNVNEPVTLSVDAGPKALGACLLQNDQPVAYATKALSPAQQNYPQIEKEALAIRFACARFHEYVYGKELLVESDHKPLETIFKKPLHSAPMRLQRILWDVLQYSPKVKYVKGTEVPIADALSRDCLPEEEEEEIEFSIHAVVSMTEEANQRFIISTEKDEELQQLKSIVMKGWPANEKEIPEIVRKYANFKEEITFDEGLLFKGHKVIVPKCEVGKIVKDVHKGHPGLSKSLERARQSLYWYGQTKQIKEFVERCSVCQQTQTAKTKEPQLQRTIPEYPFQLVSTDLFKFKGEDYLLLADHYSGFIDFQQMKNTTTSPETIECLKEWFSVHGIPEIVESDGGPQYSSKAFSDFAKEWGFQHQPSSPRYPKSNGFAERNVQTAKNLLKRCWLDKTDYHMALLMLRNTPRNDILKSPMERLSSRKTRTILPIKTEELKPKVVEGVTNELRRLRIEQGVYADKISNPMKPLEVGESVRMQKGHRDWVEAEVLAKTRFPRSVVVQTSEGNAYRRNSHHLRRTKVQKQSTQSSTTLTHTSEQSTDAKEDRKEAKNQQPKKTRSGRTVKPVEKYQSL